jgi:hypothetical protein
VSQPAGVIPGRLAEAGFSLIGAVLRPSGSGGQAYVAHTATEVVVAFRGSGGDNVKETFGNIRADINVKRVSPRAICSSPGAALVHEGFYTNYLGFRESVRAALGAAPGKAVYVTGFSLGSALACFCAFDIAENLQRTPTVMMLGAPRTGNAAWAKRWEQAVPRGLRMALEEDPFARVPPASQRLKAFCHLSNYLDLAYDGTPVPLDKIDGRLTTLNTQNAALAAHNRDRYAEAIAVFCKKFADNPNIIGAPPSEAPLAKAAAAEVESVGRLEEVVAAISGKLGRGRR